MWQLVKKKTLGSSIRPELGAEIGQEKGLEPMG
jgi:hypothetical protein